MNIVNRILIILLLVFIIIPGCAKKPEPKATPKQTPVTQPTEAFTLDAHHEEILDKLGEIKTYKADLVNTIHESDAENNLVNTIITNVHTAVKFPGKSYTKSENNTVNPTIITIMNLDKNEYWIYIPEQKLVQKADLSKLNKIQIDHLKNATDPIYMMKMVFTRLKMKYSRDEKLNGKTMRVFITYNPWVTRIMPNVEGIKYEEYWINPKDGLVYKYRVFDDLDREVMVNETKSVQINKSIDDKLFTFKPPEGVEVVDISEQLKANIPGQVTPVGPDAGKPIGTMLPMPPELPPVKTAPSPGQ
ncbi:MAG: hypothetical protein J7M18_03815 [Candidatus Eremiobacteraeota bacterium]|nr:hypothetical protein [Candidatus Eremiobacteraeota bacterium]